MIGTPLALMVGLAQGARHALEPDHLVAVSTLATQHRTEHRRRALWLGATWGLGHASSIVLLGGALTLAGATMPASIATGFELLVACVLMGLGARSLAAAWRAERGGVPVGHSHGGVHHSHGTSGQHVHVQGMSLAVRPLTVGLLHGLAGTGALTAALVTDLPSVEARLLYLTVFALGSVVGMGVLTVLATPLLTRLKDRAATRLSGVAGAISLCAGVAWAVLALG